MFIRAPAILESGPSVEVLSEYRCCPPSSTPPLCLGGLCMCRSAITAHTPAKVTQHPLCYSKHARPSHAQGFARVRISMHVHA